MHDAQCEWNTGRWQFVLDAGEARLERGGDGTIELGIGALSSLYTGYTSPWQLASAGLLHGGGAADHAALAAAFAGPTPWMPDFY